jgi:hypothetical protein
VVYQPVINQEEIYEAYKMAEEDLDRERQGSPCFDTGNTPRLGRQEITLEPGPSASRAKRTSRQRSATPQRPQMPQIPFAIPQNFTAYGGTTPDGVQYYGSVEALNGHCMQIESTKDGNCFFQ